MSNKRRSHIKRAKVLRGSWWMLFGSNVTHLGRTWDGDWRILNRPTRKAARVAQAMRGYYQD